MSLDLFAGIPVSDLPAALEWYQPLLGGPPPTSRPHAQEAAWQLAEHRHVSLVHEPARAGHALVLLFVDDLEDRLAILSGLGRTPTARENFSNGVTKVIFTDTDGNAVALDGASDRVPAEAEEHADG